MWFGIIIKLYEHLRVAVVVIRGFINGFMYAGVRLVRRV